MRITMNATRFGSPDGIKVNEYVKGTAYDVPGALADDFIAAGFAESDEPVEAAVLSWPPTDVQIAEMSFSALGVLLEGKGVALGPLKSVEARQAAIRELIEAEAPAPWPAGNDDGKIPDAHLARQLKARGVDVSTIQSRDEAEAKLREVLGVPEDEKVELPTDEQIDGMDEATLATLLLARGVDITPLLLDEGKAELKAKIAAERTAQE